MHMYTCVHVYIDIDVVILLKYFVRCLLNMCKERNEMDQNASEQSRRSFRSDTFRKI